MKKFDVIVIGGGPAGLSTSIYTAENGLDTLILDDGRSILKRNAHLENFLGFPEGVNSKLFLKMGRDQAENCGASIQERYVTELEELDEGFRVCTQEGQRFIGRNIVVATKIETEFLPEEIATYTKETFSETGEKKNFIETDNKGSTSLERVFAVGRIAGKPDQAIIAAGHGAEVGMAILERENSDFYNDWVMPDGYFSLRGYDVPDGCEEIDEEERKRKEKISMKAMRDYFSQPFSKPNQRAALDYEVHAENDS